MKSFKPGDLVVVLAGRYSGRVGQIVEITRGDEYPVKVGFVYHGIPWSSRHYLHNIQHFNGLDEMLELLP